MATSGNRDRSTVSLYLRTVLAYLTIFCATTASSSAEEARIWKSEDGKFSVEAEFVDIENDIVQLRRTDNNKTVSVPLKMLSRTDRKYIRNHSGPSKDTSKLTHGRAAWMEGQWGFRFNMPGMKQADALAEFDVQKMMDQIKVLDTATWVQVNVTQGANGSYYTSPHAELAKHVSPDIVPKRDLFGEMLNALDKQGFKVMVYFATEGPTMGKHPEKALTERNRRRETGTGPDNAPVRYAKGTTRYLLSVGSSSMRTRKRYRGPLIDFQSKGAIAWAVALADAKNKRAPLAAFQFEQLEAINAAVKKTENSREKQR